MTSQKARLFASVKGEQKPSLTHLEDHQTVDVIGISDEGTQLHVSAPLQVTEPYEIKVSSIPLPVTAVQDDIITIEEDILISPGTELDVVQHYATPPQLHKALADFWTKRWCREPPSQGAWFRILAFAQHYMPQDACSYDPITAESWMTTNKRYKAKAARGLDGFSGRDLLWMPLQFTESLVQQIGVWEAHGRWPTALQTGFVHPLPKKDGAIQVGDYRPIIIYSTI